MLIFIDFLYTLFPGNFSAIITLYIAEISFAARTNVNHPIKQSWSTFLSSLYFYYQCIYWIYLCVIYINMLFYNNRIFFPIPNSDKHIVNRILMRDVGLHSHHGQLQMFDLIIKCVPFWLGRLQHVYWDKNQLKFWLSDEADLVNKNLNNVLGKE